MEPACHLDRKVVVENSLEKLAAEGIDLDWINLVVLFLFVPNPGIGKPIENGRANFFL